MRELLDHIHEADIFRPASKKELEQRKSEWVKVLEKTGVKISFRVPPMPERMGSFWYNGEVADITYTAKDGEKRLLVLTAVGEIRVKFQTEGEEEGEWYRDEGAAEEAMRRGWKDRDLTDEYDDAVHPKVRWENNNWFEFLWGSSKWNALHDISVMEGMDVMGDYDEALERGVEFITNDKEWHEWTDSFVNEADVFKPADAAELARRKEEFRKNIVTDDDINELSDDILEVAKDEADDIYEQLKKQYEYLTSDEGVTEELRNNEREFDVDPETGALLEAKQVFKPASKEELAKREAKAKADRVKSGKVLFDDLSPEDRKKVIEDLQSDGEYPGYDWWEGDIGQKWKDRNGKYHETKGYFDEELEKKGFLDTEIHFSGFYSQGDGACFECSLDVAKIVKHYKIEVRPLVLKEIEAGTFYGKISAGGRYSHSNTMEIELQYDGELHERVKA